MTLTKTYRGFETSVVFDWNYKHQARIKINQGGTSSGKTYSILQVIFIRLIEKKRIATVVGQDIPNLKKGALRDFEQRILPANPWMNDYIESYNRSDRVFKFKNGSILEFTSFSDFQDAKNGKREISFFNEANGIPWAIYEQVALRTTEEVFLDYNPSSPFWAHERLMSLDNSVTFYSNFTHNPFLPQSTIDEIRALKETDIETWKVYGLGKTGTISEAVFEKVTVIEKMPKHLKKEGYGIDFGYRADPTALLHCGLANEKDIYFDELIYTRRMKTKDIADSFDALKIPKRTRICADGADGRAVDDLKLRGYNIQAADKGPGSIIYGINLLNQYNIFITERSVNMLEEQKKYRYKIESKGDKAGQILNQPIDAFNHAWDAARYWAIMNLKPAAKVRRTFRGGLA